MSESFNFGDIGLKPVTDDWGMSRGRAVDRYYIERFLERNSKDIKGHVVEVGDARYTNRFGGANVTKSDVWDINTNNRQATILADLSNAPQVPSESFDCFILTQVLVLIRDVPSALSELYRVLRPGGVALISVPGISQIATKPAVAEFTPGPSVPCSWIPSLRINLFALKDGET
jgi:SAM-dependent methyltransferase